jgi:hypothetical protein
MGFKPNDGIHIKKENFCSLTGKKCWKKVICKDCEEAVKYKQNKLKERGEERC